MWPSDDSNAVGRVRRSDCAFRSVSRGFRCVSGLHENCSAVGTGELGQTVHGFAPIFMRRPARTKETSPCDH
jgi:hypothetical protein